MLRNARKRGPVDAFPADRVVFHDRNARPAPRVHLREADVTVAGSGGQLRNLRMRKFLLFQKGDHFIVQGLADRLAAENELADIRFAADGCSHRLAVRAADQFQLAFRQISLQAIGHFGKFLDHQLERPGVEIDARLDVRRFDPRFPWHRPPTRRTIQVPFANRSRYSSNDCRRRRRNDFSLPLPMLSPGRSRQEMRAAVPDAKPAFNKSRREIFCFMIWVFPGWADGCSFGGERCTTSFYRHRFHPN